MYSMKRRMVPVPRKCSAMSAIESSLTPRLTTMFTLTGRPGRAARRRCRPAPARPGSGRRSCAEHRVVERVEADRDAVEAGVAQRRPPCAVSSEPLVVSARSRRPSLAERLSIADQRLEVAPQQRLAAGQADLLDAAADEDPRQPRRSPRRSAARTRRGTGSRARTPRAACSRCSGSCSDRSPRSADPAAAVRECRGRCPSLLEGYRRSFQPCARRTASRGIRGAYRRSTSW